MILNLRKIRLERTEQETSVTVRRNFEHLVQWLQGEAVDETEMRPELSVFPARMGQSDLGISPSQIAQVEAIGAPVLFFPLELEVRFTELKTIVVGLSGERKQSSALETS